MIFLIFLCLIIGLFSKISDYIREDAIEYAKKYCDHYNDDYSYLSNKDTEPINFVSQCLFAGGQSFSGCRGKNMYGMIYIYNDLTTCLYKKGWKFSETKNDKIKEGYPALIKGSRKLVIITGFKDNKVIYCGHKKICNKELDQDLLAYFYLDK